MSVPCVCVCVCVQVVSYSSEKGLVIFIVSSIMQAYAQYTFTIAIRLECPGCNNYATQLNKAHSESMAKKQKL